MNRPVPLAAMAIAGCPLFPADNHWNQRVDRLPVHPQSGAIVQTIGNDRTVHPDFGSGLYEGRKIGIPYKVVPRGQRKVPVRFEYAEESDRGPYPIPPNPPIEGGGDRHILLVQRGTCRLYELFAADNSGGSWTAGSGAIFNLRSNRLRPRTWTSADAAGLPILPGLARFRRGQARRDPPRAALHRQPHARRVRLPGAPRGLEPERRVAAAHGRAPAAQERRRTRTTSRASRA